MRVIVLHQAEIEFNQSIDHYESKEPGLVLAFARKWSSSSTGSPRIPKFRGSEEEVTDGLISEYSSIILPM